MNLDTMKSSDVKKVLKQAGFDTKLISVSKVRSYMRVTLNSYSISVTAVEETLKKYETLKNVSHDMDSIYVGTGLIVEYNFWATIPQELENAFVKARSEFADVNTNGYHISQVVARNNPEILKHFGTLYKMRSVCQRLGLPG